MAAKLHELLAAESNRAAAYNAVGEETLKVFGKPDHFVRTTKSIEHFDESERHLDVSETKDNVTTVSDRVAYTFGKAWVDFVDLVAEKEDANQRAQADVVVGGQTILAKMPCLLLLGLESKLAELRGKLLAAPTLQPGPKWVWDAQEQLFKTAEPKITFRTKKTIRPMVLVQATKEHPAQVDKITEDVPVARISEVTWSGMWTSTRKHEVLARLDDLLVAVKRARQKANQVEVVSRDVGKPIADYLLAGGDGPVA